MPERRRVTIVEAVEPDPVSHGTRMMARGEPGLPRRFTWRGTSHTVAEVLETRRETEGTPEGADRYVRRHVVRVRTTYLSSASASRST